MGEGGQQGAPVSKTENLLLLPEFDSEQPSRKLVFIPAMLFPFQAECVTLIIDEKSIRKFGAVNFIP
jgi:hypothetical protein